MPGICGFVGGGVSEENTRVLRVMVQSMRHEPFYVVATYPNEMLGLWVGCVSCEHSFSDRMPIWNEEKNVCIFFFGEDYTDIADIQRLKARGCNVSAGNSAYLVHLYEEIGIEFIQRLNGWFAGVLVDLREQIVVIFNDRYGLGRLYYHENSRGFFFASEAKSLLSVLPELRQLDLKSLGETFSCGCVLQNRTLFSRIALLPGGSLWAFKGKRNVRKDRYFHREVWENQAPLTGPRFYEDFKETFARILPRYFRGSERVAMSLTGGLDGRMIMAWADRPPGELPCYTFGGSNRDCNDVIIARRVAKICRQSHETVAVGSEFLKDFANLAEKAVYLSDGTMDVSGSVELYVNRIARRIAPVRLTGSYGSEIVRGNVAFKPGYFNENLLEPEFARLVRAASATYDREREGHKVSFIAFKQVPWHHYPRFAVECSQLRLRLPYLDNNLVSLMYQAPPDLLLSTKPSLRLIADGNADLARIPTDRGVLYRPIPILTLLHRLYMEFTFKAEYMFDQGMPQWLARIDNLLAPLHLEQLFLGQHKFYHFRVWYRDNLSEYLKDILLDERTRNRPYLNGGLLEEMVKKHLAGTRNYTSEMHRILTTEIIQRKLIEQ